MLKATHVLQGKSGRIYFTNIEYFYSMDAFRRSMCQAGQRPEADGLIYRGLFYWSPFHSEEVRHVTYKYLED